MMICALTVIFIHAFLHDDDRPKKNTTQLVVALFNRNFERREFKIVVQWFIDQSLHMALIYSGKGFAFCTHVD